MSAENDSSNETAIPVIFISYAHADMATARAIDQWLRNQSARVLIDQRDFIPGNDIEDEIVRCIRNAGKLICIFSKNSATRPYPQLERRIAAELERSNVYSTSAQKRLIYFCIDETELPLEAKPRLAIMAKDKSFQDACQDLWSAILEESRDPIEIDLSRYENAPPWNDEALQETLKKTEMILSEQVKNLLIRSSLKKVGMTGFAKLNGSSKNIVWHHYLSLSKE
jgi:hypothetical protein